MKTESTFSILFWIKRSRLQKGKAPIYARLTINGKRSEISAQREVSILDWDPKAQAVKPRNQQAKEINNHLLQLKYKLLQCQTKVELKGLDVTADSLKNEFAGVIEKPRLLLEIMQQHNNDVQKLIGKDYTITTWRKYRRTLELVQDFIKWKFKQNDINIKMLNFSFINDFEFFLKIEKKVDPGTNPKYIKNLRKIVRSCVAKDWLDKDPFLAYKLKIKKSERGYLSNLELQAIQDKHFDIERLDHVKDVFLFSCFTGISYIDIFNLTPQNISVGIDGQKWVFTRRHKTNTPSRVPLLQPVLEIIEKYKDHPICLNRKCLLPIPSNQKLNAYLKEIAACCDINKKLTFHMARHTFATIVTLNNGVSIESVSKMLGHTRIQTTQIYAKILDEKVSQDMGQLRTKLENKSSSIPSGTSKRRII